MVLWVKGERWGTLSFSAREVHPQPFDSADLEFMRLLARWVSATLERELQEQQRDELLQRLQRLTEQVPGIILQLQLHSDGRRTLPYASEALLSLTGLDPEHLRDDSSALFQRIASQDLAIFESSLAQSAQQLKPWIGEFRLNHPQRGELWLGGQATPQRLGDGSLLWHVLLLDISARKQAQSDLTRERQRLRSILEGANCGTWEWNIQSGECHFDTRWLSLLGYAANELQPHNIRHWLELTHPEDLQRAQAVLQAHLEGESSHFVSEFRMRHKDDHWVWIESRGRLLSRTSAGEPLMMYGTHLDISARVSAEQHNRQTQLFLQNVLDSSTEVSVVATDTSGLITLFNSGAEHLLGYQAHEVIGCQSPALFHLESEVRARSAELSTECGHPVEGFAVFVTIPRREGTETRQWTYLHKDGSRRQVLLTVSLLYDAEAQFSGYLGIATDISELVSLSQALQGSEQRFRGMLSNLPGAAYRCRNDAAWTMFHISDEIERITGYPASDFVDNRVRSYASVILPEDLAITYSTQQNLASKVIFELSYRLRHRDGHIVWVSEKGRGEYDENDHLQWIDGFIWDISEQRRAEQMVIEREAYLRTLLDNVIDAIITIDEHGLIESFNQAAERIFGYSASEVHGRNVSLLMPEPDRSAHDGYIGRYHNGGQARVLGVSGRELLGLRRDGTLFHMELAVSAIQYQGARRFIGVVRDITERRRIEQMKNEFVSTVSHELRTPLTSISGALGLIAGGALGEVPEPMRDMLQIAHQNSRRLGLLINDLLDMEKLVAGKMTFHFSELDLLAQLEEALLHNQPYADEHGVGWRISQPLAGIRVSADSQRLQQVLANLLSNAAKFSPGGSQVEVRMSRCAPGVRVSVIDQGPGIPAEFQARIFSKFSQADASDTRQKGGTGLGLAISKEMMERMGGQIGFDSPPRPGRLLLDRTGRTGGRMSLLPADRVEPGARYWPGGRLPLALAGLLLLLLLGFSELLLHQVQQRRIDAQRQQVSSQAGELRARLLNELNGTLHLATGLAAYLQSRNGAIDEAALQPWIEGLTTQSRHIRNIALAPDNRISYVYPLAGNEGALGLHYPDIPQQWPAVQRTIASRQPVLDGPITLRQGGQGLAYRVPVFLRDGRYWGLISTVIDIPSLLRELSSAARSMRLEIALFSHPDDSSPPMLGNPTWRAQAHSQLQLPVPGGQWLLLARSTETASGAGMFWLRLLAWSLSLIIGGMLALMLRAAQQQQRARQALDESRQRFALAFVTAPQGMALLTPQGRWLAVNQQFCHLLGRSAAELQQADLLSLVAEPEQAQARSHLQATQAQPQQWESRLLDAFGQTIDCQLGAAWVEGRPPCLILQCQDIREQKRIERLKSEFVATVSHELRTPLTSISGALGLVVNGALGEVPASMREMLRIAEQNSQRLTLLINDLLDMEKLSAGKMVFQLQRQPLRPLLEEALDSNRAYAERFAVSLQLSGNCTAQVRVDRLRLQQVLANLLSNAAKFTAPGSTVEVQVAQHDAEVTVRVVDQGSGIPEAFQAHIFHKFVQADASDSRSNPGTGLGLAISKELIERMDGTIGFTSSSQGSTFWFSLPLAETTPPATPDSD